MKQVGIVTDSNSGITQEQGKELGIAVLPMPFFINDKVTSRNNNLALHHILQFSIC